VYATRAPGWVNNLGELRFGESYWISLTQAITLQLGGGSASALAGVTNLQSPPATYYGQVLAGRGLTPVEGMTVTAWVNGKQCGQGRTLSVDGQVMYKLYVFGDGPGGAAGCGDVGRKVIFKVDSQSMSPEVMWDHNQVWQVDLDPTWRVYLPVILR
jgi:hypothetical protein